MTFNFVCMKFDIRGSGNSNFVCMKINYVLSSFQKFISLFFNFILFSEYLRELNSVKERGEER